MFNYVGCSRHYHNAPYYDYFDTGDDNHSYSGNLSPSYPSGR